MTMMQIHDLEKQQFITLFKEEGIDNIDERFTILETFLKTEKHITADDLSRLLADEGHTVETDFLRETLELMCHYGFAQENRFDNGRVLYEHRHLGDHHDHMICTRCGEITEFADTQLERLQEAIAARHGFHMLQHRMDIYGICSSCLKKRVPLMPLMLAKPGEKLIIREYLCGENLEARLLSMGLRRGDVIEVITSQGRGQFVIAVENKRYILGRGMAQKIMVEPIR
ncbi:Fur family transcriptional regulator, ferric uptake regulator [Desulfoluna spongiiphila]|uniref:Ferric uptake regulation protein n=2 Tax=Desulfoluna spongiiphila TaxID=419481 RepID=A0A1G5I5F0_9BACT|nr:Fur family transcriptional regulator, ferric uptake regulator [Desulfoluna spongiiphila]VVS92695.1 ferric-uptake regulator [Desulfoluna spongiiphila]